MPNESVYLEYVDERSNKFYEMIDNDDGTFTAFYGRVGVAKPQRADYDVSLWNKKLREKKNKGYEEI